MASRKRDLIKTFLQLTVYLLWKPPVTAIQPSTLEPTTYKLRNYHITISNTSPYFACYPSNDFFDQSILKMRTRRETVTKDHDTENEKSNDEGRPVGTVKQDMEISSENGIHSNPEISSAEIGLIDDVEHHEIDIDSLVTKTLQRFSSSKYNSKSKACSTLHSRLMSSGKLGDRKLQTLKGAIENRTWKAGDVMIKPPARFDVCVIILDWRSVSLVIQITSSQS